MIRFNVTADPEDVVYTGDNCKLKINSGNFENGQLLLTNSDICWRNLESNEGLGFSIPWEKITVQAITQEPQRCVYFMIDVVWPGEDTRNGNSNGENHSDEQNGVEDENEDAASEESLAEITEFHIIPSRPEEVDEIYYIMTKFPAEAPMDEESDDDAFFDGEQIDQMNIGDDNNDDEDRFQDP